MTQAAPTVMKNQVCGNISWFVPSRVSLMAIPIALMLTTCKVATTKTHMLTNGKAKINDKVQKYTKILLPSKNQLTNIYPSKQAHLTAHSVAPSAKSKQPLWILKPPHKSRKLVIEARCRTSYTRMND